jgi:PAB-dependent poly(A)-specific ribonuclease subunit 3
MANVLNAVFHQADGAGSPVLDLGHVITALNKLDAADEEKIVLTSRDGKSLMVVSYADVARCLDSAFRELCAGSVPPSALQY